MSGIGLLQPDVYNLPMTMFNLTNKSNFTILRFWDVYKYKYKFKYLFLTLYAAATYYLEPHSYVFCCFWLLKSLLTFVGGWSWPIRVDPLK